MATPQITKLAFEKYYDDDSGVRAAVKYDSTAEDAVSIMSWSDDHEATFPVADLDWLIECLQRVRSELPTS